MATGRGVKTRLHSIFTELAEPPAKSDIARTSKYGSIGSALIFNVQARRVALFMAVLSNLMAASCFGASADEPKLFCQKDDPACKNVQSGTQEIETVTVTGRRQNLLGVATSANQGSVSADDLALRPLLRPGEVVENIPGVIVTQHSGSGKANQYFLRGFNLDHGTDLAISVDGMPVNMPSHAHGQGYADLNFVIPELITAVDYKKGPYYADVGDFGAAGAFGIRYVNAMPGTVAKVEFGEVGYARAVAIDGSDVRGGRLISALEIEHNEGPWINGDDERKLSGVLRYAVGDEKDGATLTAMAYSNRFNSTDQIPDRAIVRSAVSRFGEIDATDGGSTGRYSLSGAWHSTSGTAVTEAAVYAFYYDLDLFSNFTYFLNDPVHGDQFEQQDNRHATGGHIKRTWQGALIGVPLTQEVGFELRRDEIRNGLFQTQQRHRLSTGRVDSISETSAAPYYQNVLHWAPWLRTIVGVRADVYRFEDRNIAGGSSGNVEASLLSPKIGIVVGPWANTEVYLNGGDGFHSNDARGVTAATDPARPLARARGGEVGVRTSFIPGLQSSLSYFILDIASELVYSGDSGTTEPSGPTRRTGLEFSNFYTPFPWLTLDADYAVSRARYTDHEPDGDYVPEALDGTFDGGIAVHDLPGWASDLSAGLRLRYFGSRPLTQDNGVRSEATTLLYADLGYRLSENWNIKISIFNLFDARSSDIDYYYTSRLAGEPAAGLADVHTHPSEPREVRLSLVAQL